MEDARFISNYKPSAIFEKEMQVKNKISSNEDYRTFLVKNGNTIMNNNKINAFHQTMNIDFNTTLDKNHGPYVFDTIHSTIKPRGYQTNETKELYLSRKKIEALQFNKIKNINV